MIDIENFRNYKTNYCEDFNYSCIDYNIYILLGLMGVKNPIFYFDSALSFFMEKDITKSFVFLMNRDALLPQYFKHLEEYNMYNLSSEIVWMNIKKKLDQRIPVIVFIDPFYFEYTSYFKKRHLIHSVIVYDYNEADDSLYIIDDYKWFKNGRISLNTYKVTMEKGKINPDIPNTKKWFMLDLNNWKEGDIISLFIQNIDNTIYQYYDVNQNNNQIRGINCLKEILLFLEENIFYSENSINIIIKVKDAIYTFLSRLRAHRFFLKLSYQQINNIYLLELLNRLDKDIINWNTVLNVIIKTQICLNEHMYNKVINYLKSAIVREEERYEIILNLKYSISISNSNKDT